MLIYIINFFSNIQKYILSTIIRSINFTFNNEHEIIEKEGNGSLGCNLVSIHGNLAASGHSRQAEIEERAQLWSETARRFIMHLSTTI